MQVHDTAMVHPDTQLDAGASVGPYAVVGVDGWDADAGPARLDAGTVISSHSVVLRGVRVHAGAFVSPGAVVDTDVPRNAIVAGNPAQIVGYRDQSLGRPVSLIDPSTAGPVDIPVRGVTLVELDTARDLRGSLVAFEFAGLPFDVRRLFSVSGVPDRKVRGSHAHRATWQALWCVEGSVRCLVDDGRSRAEVLLAPHGRALVMPPMTWGTQYRYTSDAVLNVAASAPYDADDYVRDYGDFLALVDA